MYCDVKILTSLSPKLNFIYFPEKPGSVHYLCGHSQEINDCIFTNVDNYLKVHKNL